MAENSNIEWTEHTFNPWIGCTRVSPACDNCYAETWDARFGGERWGPHAPRTRTKSWRGPRKWNRLAGEAGMRARVFVASLADVFDNHRSIEQSWRDDLWALIRDTPNLDWLLLTKRPQNIARYLPPDWGAGYSNVWVGITVEDRVEADRRIPHLLSIPARIRFASCEPLVEAIDLEDVALPGGRRGNALTAEQGLDWVIAGGETGPDARPSHPDRMRGLRDQCARADVPFLFKQWGDWHADSLLCTEAVTGICPPPSMKIGKKRAGRLLDGIEHNGVPGGHG